MMRRYLLIFACMTTMAVHAGSLTPPPGPPGPTMKSLDEVEPRTAIYERDLPLTISQPGSYYLAENIRFGDGAHGIRITTAGVAIDLNEFTLHGDGPKDSVPRYSAIHADSATTGVVILNGVITDWSGTGINIQSQASTITNVRVRRCHSGIVCNNVQMKDCVIEFNRFSAFRQYVGPNNPTMSIISDNIISNNGSHGMQIYQPTYVLNNTCSRNGGTGISVHTDGCRIEGNHLFQNAKGIYLFRSVAIKNTAHGNGQDYDFFPGSVHGPVITGSTVLTSQSPWANISF